MKADAVVVGGGFAALEIALALRKQRREMAVAVVSTATEVTYRPWLIKFPAAGAEPPLIPFAGLLNAAGVDVISDTAAGVDLDARRVILDSGTAVEFRQFGRGNRGGR